MTSIRPSGSPRLPTLSGLALSLTLALGCTNSDSAPKADAPAQKSETKTDEAEAAPPAEKLPEAAELLAQAVEAAGGADSIEGFDTIHMQGKIESDKQKIKGTSELWWRKDGSFYGQQNIEGVGPTEAGYDGETLWMKDPITGLRKLDGEEAAAYLQSALMFPANDWRDHFSAAKTIAKKPLEGGGEVYEVELTSAKGGPPVILGLDVDSKLIRYLSTTQVSPMGSMPIQANAENYESVEGYKFPMVKRTTIQGLIEVREDITTFEANVPVADENMFVFPEEREAVPTDPAAQPAIEAPPPSE
jgi:hypothetical protein